MGGKPRDEEPGIRGAVHVTASAADVGLLGHLAENVGGVEGQIAKTGHVGTMAAGGFGMKHLPRHSNLG